MIETIHIVEVTTEKCKFVAYYFGEAEHNGKSYKLVSPYQDDRPKHWLEVDTPMRTIVSLFKE